MAGFPNTLARFAPRSFLVGLGVGVFILNLLVVFMAIFSIRQSRNHSEERAVASAQNLAQVLDRYVTDTFDKADLAVLAAKDEMEQALTQPAGKTPDLDAFLQRQLSRAPHVLALRATNAHGIITHGTGSDRGVGVDLSERDFFLRLRESPDSGKVISSPILGKVVKKWILTLARRLEGPGHSFAGIVYAVIELDQFERAFSALDLGSKGSVALRGMDLGLLARYPAPHVSGTAVGERRISPELDAFAHSGQSIGVYRARTPFDGIVRTFSVRRLAGLPFYLLVGLAEQDYLLGWRRDTRLQLCGVSLFIGLTLVASWLIHRAWVRQQEGQRTLEKLLAEVKTLEGLLPICSHCKKVRDDQGYWNQIDSYLHQHINAEFTHGICPDCAKEFFSPSTGEHPGT